MDQPLNLESLPKKDRIKLALQATKEPQNLSVQRAAVVYNVLKSTLYNWRARKQLKRDKYPKLLALTKAEEQTLVQYIKKLNTWGLALIFY